MRGLVVSLLLGATVGCGGAAGSRFCALSSECDLAMDGMCVPAGPSQMFCAYPDPDCGSQFRWSEQAGNGLAGQCLQNAAADAGIDGSVSEHDANSGEFAESFGSPAGDVGRSVAVGTHDEIVLVGDYKGMINLGGMDLLPDGNGMTDCFVAKLTSSGEHSWSRRIGGDAFEYCVGGIDALGNAVVGGVFFEDTIDFGNATYTADGLDIFAAKYAASDGAPIWAIKLGGGDIDALEDMAIDHNANQDVVLVGEASAPADLGNGVVGGIGNQDVFIGKYSGLDGSYIWAKLLGGSALDSAKAVAVSPDRDIFVAAEFEGTANFGGASLSSSSGSRDIAIAKYLPNGSHIWSVRTGGGGLEIARDIAIDAHGDAYVVGGFDGFTSLGGALLMSAGMRDMFVAKYSGLDGAHLWSRRFGGALADVATAASIDDTGHLLVLGEFMGAVDFGSGSKVSNAASRDLVVLSLDESDGSLISVTTYGGPGDETASGLSRDAMGRVLLTGAFQATVDFGVGVLHAVGMDDVFLARLRR